MTALLKIDKKVQEVKGQKIAVVTLVGHVGPRTVLYLEENVTRILHEGVKHLVLESSKLEYMNSTGAALIVKIVDMFSEVGGSVQMTNLSKAICDLLEVLGFLDRIIVVRATVKEALAAI